MSWGCSITITPRPSSAPRSSSSACSPAVRSESVACCSSRSLSGRFELKRMASRAAEISLTGRLLSRLDMDRTETLLLAHHDERSAQELQDRDEDHTHFTACLRYQD